MFPTEDSGPARRKLIGDGVLRELLHGLGFGFRNVRMLMRVSDGGQCACPMEINLSVGVSALPQIRISDNCIYFLAINF